MKHKPDFESFKLDLTGRRSSTKLHMADLLIDDGILKQYTTGILKRNRIEHNVDEKACFINYTEYFHDMGFDYIPVHFWIQNTFRILTWIAHDIDSDSVDAIFSCGDVYTHNVINMLLDDVGIDAVHSVQDSILQTNHKRLTGKRQICRGYRQQCG